MSETTQLVSSQKECGCKGIRTCFLCSPYVDQIHDAKEETSRTIFDYCIKCNTAWTSPKVVESFESQLGTVTSGGKVNQDDSDIADSECFNSSSKTIPINGASAISPHTASANAKLQIKTPFPCSHQNAEPVTDFDGIAIIENFVTEEEEQFLDAAIGQSEFVKSQSGRRKQDYGPKVNFKRQKLKTASFSGLPSYSQFLYERMKAQSALKDFEPVELCNLEYCSERGAHIDPHFDDAWLWGERLVTLNLLSESTLTFSNDSEPDFEIRVPLFRRSLIVVSSSARYKWKHCINAADVGERRIAMTFRELSKEFSCGGDREHEGSELLKLALTFQGCAVGS